MHLIYFLQQKTFVLYDNFRFAGVPEEKKFWQFLKKFPPNLPDILNECGFQVTAPANEQPIFQEKNRFLKRTVCITVFDQGQQQNVSTESKEWIEALNTLTTLLTRVESAASET